MAKQPGRQHDRFLGLGRTVWIPPPFSTPYACVRSRLYPFPFPVNVNAHACTFLAICSSLPGGMQRARRGAIRDVDEAKPVLLAPFVRKVRFSWRAGESEVVDRGRPDNRVGATRISEESRKFSASSPLSFPPRWVYFHEHPESCATFPFSLSGPPVRPVFSDHHERKESAPWWCRELDSPKSDRCAKTHSHACTSRDILTYTCRKKDTCQRIRANGKTEPGRDSERENIEGQGARRTKSMSMHTQWVDTRHNTISHFFNGSWQCYLDIRWHPLCAVDFFMRFVYSQNTLSLRLEIHIHILNYTSRVRHPT